jgi:hypothetical protein
MRLLRRSADGTFCLTEAPADNIPNYAILSHTWLGDHEEVIYQDMIASQVQDKVAGYSKIQFCVEQAAKDEPRILMGRHVLY